MSCWELTVSLMQFVSSGNRYSKFQVSRMRVKRSPKKRENVMKKTSVFALVFPIVLLLTVTATALGQEKIATPEGAVVITRTGTTQGEKTATPGVNTFTFVNSEFIYDGASVKGAPYTGQAVTETTQTLADGNRIVNRSTATLYRDSEGRTRREQTLKSISGMTSGNPAQTILISDPVAGVSYTLDPANKIARKNGSWQFQRTPAAAGAGSGNMVYFGQGSGAGAGVGQGQSGPGPGAGAASAQFSAVRTPGGEVKVTTGSGESQVFYAQVPTTATRVPFNAEANYNTEKLGTQVVEGVSAEGTRTTTTIAAGTIGNERPIEIVDERWYSPDLKTMVMTRHTDPRSGEMVYRLTNIDRTEQPHSLFEVPADYQIKEGPAAPMPARTRKPLE